MNGARQRKIVVEASFHMPRHHVDEERRLVVRLRDVSEREQQSRALDQARRRFQQAFQSAPTGMALVRNWVVDVDTEDVFTSKAFALGLGAGWEWPLGRRLAAQAFGSQHVATLGDLTGSGGVIVENVVGNFWTIGGAIVIR